jgi:hypothetical protein
MSEFFYHIGNILLTFLASVGFSIFSTLLNFTPNPLCLKYIILHLIWIYLFGPGTRRFISSPFENLIFVSIKAPRRLRFLIIPSQYLFSDAKYASFEKDFLGLFLNSFKSTWSFLCTFFLALSEITLVP